MLNEFIKGGYRNRWKGPTGGQGVAVLGQDIGMGTGIRTTGGEVAVEVGIDLTVTGTGVKKEIIIIEVGASVEVLIIARTVEEAADVMRGVAGVGRKEVPLLLDVAPVLEGAHPHAGLLLGAEVLVDEITKNVPQLQKALHHQAELLILKPHLHVIPMLMNKGVVFGFIYYV